MKVKDIIAVLENVAPSRYQESYDNSGLIVGDPHMETTGAIISLDATVAVVEEAISKEVNMVISHHPIVFKGLKRFNGSNYVEKAVMLAIKHDIALYAIHTNLDNVAGGVNTKIANVLGLHNQTILNPKSNVLSKLVVFVPVGSTGVVLDAMYKAGAGNVGNYSQCSFRVEGKGTFKGNTSSDPQLGARGVYEEVEENRIEVIFPSHIESRLLKAMTAAHPYEEVAHYVTTIENKNQNVGSGVLGKLKVPVKTIDFLNLLKERFNLHVIKHTAILKEEIETVALCGGSGGFLLNSAIAQNADVFITADYKYHEYFDADGKIMIADIGHFESEQFTKDLIQDIISEKIPNFASYLSQVRTNPVFYHI